MNPAPLPQPSAQTCPNCGSGVEGGVALCPRCGATLPVYANNPVGYLFGCLSALAQLLLIVIAVFFGVFGALCIVMAVDDYFSSHIVDIYVFDYVFWGSIALGIMGMCIWGIRRLNK